jgi:DNA gyrase subunit A
MAKRKTKATEAGKRFKEHIDSVPLAEATRSRYLNYALSVITSRALPDVRDGLKPVQRRILYAMWNDLNLSGDSRYTKSAAVVGEVIKSYHPHGDQSIYDALVRMAQPFTLRATLIDGYGNFGSLDGDPPAAMRYTECRLTKVAETLLEELGQATVDFRPNYAATVDEPIVLPAQFPNLLVNGALGIAVGMATSIPPHNLGEVCKALLYLLDHDRDVAQEKLLRFVQGPDFPTGGVILNTKEQLTEIYSTGQGSIKLRGTWEIDPERPEQIVVTSIPYGIEKDALVERIGQLIGGGQVPQLVNVKDLSTEDVHITLELKPGARAEAAMAYLFKHTPLQINFGVNLTCLLPAEGTEVAVPARLDLKSILMHFLDFRMDVVVRRLRFELENLRKRIHILEGFAIVFNNLDEAIRIIRASDGKADAAPKLIDRFKLSEIQADAILETKLYRLGKLEIKDILDELKAKKSRAREVERLLKDEAGRWSIVREEIKEISRKFGEPRRTRIEAEKEPVEFREEDYIVDEDAWVIVTRDGWIKRQKTFTDVASIRIRDDDTIGWIYRSRARQTVTIFTDRGIAYTIRVNDLPLTTGHGEPIQKLFAFGDQEHVIGVVCHDPRCLPVHGKSPDKIDGQSVQRMFPTLDVPANGNGKGHENGNGNGHAAQIGPPYIVAVTAGGKTLRFSIAALAPVSTKKGRIVVKLDGDVPGDRVVGVEASDGTERVILATRSARVLVFPVATVNVVAGAARGVTAIKLDSKDQVIGFALCRPDSKRDGITVRTGRGGVQKVSASKYPLTNRGGKGYGIMQRGSLDAVLPDEVEPIPPMEEVGGE